MPGPVAPFPCPQCGGKCWDNRNDPMRKPSQPLVKCKNKDGCGWAVWDADKLPAGAQSAPAQGQQVQRPLRPPPVLDKLMGACLDAALELSKKFKDGEVEGADHDITLRIAQSMFIARSDGKGILAVEVEKLKERAVKEAERKRLEAEAAAKEAQRRAEEERARQASQPQVGPGAGGDYSGYVEGWPPLEGQDPMDDLPF